jgi:hypothetical protein
MQKIAALHPGYLRVSGGNYLEGQTLATYFNWKNTIGPVPDRPGQENTAWGYWSQDGMGLPEYLEMAQEAGAQPILAVFAVYTLNGTVVPQNQLVPYVQDALDEIQYAIGPVTSKWGAMRAADGHPAPHPTAISPVTGRLGPSRPASGTRSRPTPSRCWRSPRAAPPGPARGARAPGPPRSGSNRSGSAGRVLQLHGHRVRRG